MATAAQSAWVLQLLLAALAVYADVKYTDLRNAVIDTGIQVQYKQEDDVSFHLFPVGCPKLGECSCPESDQDCRYHPSFSREDESELLISYTLPADLGEVVAKGGWGQPTAVVLKACYSALSAAGRTWRDAENAINDDKRCGKVIKAREDIVDGQTLYVVRWAIPEDATDSEWFVTLLVLCGKDVGGRRQEGFCAVDTTGGLRHLMRFTDLKEELGKEGGRSDEQVENAARRILERNTSNELYFRTANVTRFPAALIVGVGIASSLAVTILVASYLYEKWARKAK